MGKALAESLSMRQNGLSLPKSLCLRWQYMQDFGSIFVKYSQYNSIQSFYKSTLGSIFSDMCVRPREQRFSLLENYNPVNTMNPLKHRNSFAEQLSSEMWSKWVASTAKLFSRAVTQTLLFSTVETRAWVRNFTDFHRKNWRKDDHKMRKHGKDIVCPMTGVTTMNPNSIYLNKALTKYTYNISIIIQVYVFSF